MEIPLAALVDHVEETDTQLSLIGIVGLIRVNVVPTIVKRDMKLFIRVRFDPSEAGKGRGLLDRFPAKRSGSLLCAGGSQGDRKRDENGNIGED